MAIDKKMSYGERKGKMYPEVSQADPAYAYRLRQQYGEKKKPQRVEDYLEGSSHFGGPSYMGYLRERRVLACLRRRTRRALPDSLTSPQGLESILQNDDVPGLRTR